MYKDQLIGFNLIIHLLIFHYVTLSTAQINDRYNPYHDVDHAGEILEHLIIDPQKYNNKIYDPDLIPIKNGEVLDVKLHLVVTAWV